MDEPARLRCRHCGRVTVLRTAGAVAAWGCAYCGRRNALSRPSGSKIPVEGTDPVRSHDYGFEWARPVAGLAPPGSSATSVLSPRRSLSDTACVVMPSSALRSDSVASRGHSK